MRVREEVSHLAHYQEIVSSNLTPATMSIARRQRRQFERLWKKQAIKATVPVKSIEKDPALQELVNNLTKQYEADSSSK